MSNETGPSATVSGRVGYAKRTSSKRMAPETRGGSVMHGATAVSAGVVSRSSIRRSVAPAARWISPHISETVPAPLATTAA
jgi:hypothetical protein